MTSTKENMARGRQRTSKQAEQGDKQNKETMQATNTNIARQKNNVSYEHQKSVEKKQCKSRAKKEHKITMINQS